MKFTIIPDKYNSQSYSDKWSECLIQRGHDILFTNISDPGLISKIASSDGFMWRPSISPDVKQQASRILLIAEKILNKPVFPDFYTFWHYDDKVSQAYLFNALNIPTPLTWIFWNKSEALEWATKATYPLVHKLAIGAGSTNVRLIKTIGDAKSQINQNFRGRFSGSNSVCKNSTVKKRIKHLSEKALYAAKYLIKDSYPPLPEDFWQPQKNYSYFQEFVPGNEFDTRVTVIGERAFAFRRWNREGDFRASGSGRLDYDLAGVDLNYVKLAFEISKLGRFQSMAYDFLSHNGLPKLGEISYTFSDRAVFDCPGYWDMDLVWHEGQMWPEEAQVIDFLGKIVNYQ